MRMTSWWLLGKRVCSLNEDVPSAYVSVICFCHYANLHSGWLIEWHPGLFAPVETAKLVSVKLLGLYELHHETLKSFVIFAGTAAWSHQAFTIEGGLYIAIDVTALILLHVSFEVRNIFLFTWPKTFLARGLSLWKHWERKSGTAFSSSDLI